MSALDKLRSLTTVVADTGELDAIEKLQPYDATTNPSLLLKVAKQDAYRPLLVEAMNKATDNGSHDVGLAAQWLAVLVGVEISKLVPGRISTEVDARLSFNTEQTVLVAKRLIDFYQQMGVGRDKVLIKIAATWEGIKAAEILEQEGINCNLTLLFNFTQAKACAEAGVYLISPFVGRIFDWYKSKFPEADYTGQNDPGVQSVTDIYNYYRQYDYPTVVMGASFRNIEQVLSLAGCDRLTISPALLEALDEQDMEVPAMLVPQDVIGRPKELVSEEAFRWALTTDPMANEKLAEGISQFAKDQEALEALLIAIISEQAE